MNKKYLIFGGIVVAAAVGFYLFTKGKKPSDGGSDLKSADADMPTTASVRSDLQWIGNKNVASYLSTSLGTGKGKALRNWVGIIKAERAKDPSKWGDSQGLTGEASDIGHA